MKYTDSPLISYTNLTNNCNKKRTHVIDTITPHMIVGQWTAKQGCDYFKTTTRQVSANYVVGCDGTIGLSVPEQSRSWCTSNPTNDHRAVTIEIASETREPYAITMAAYNAVVDLMADIAIRNDLGYLTWKNDKSLIGKPDEQNITVHQWFSSTNCPGTYIMQMLPKMVETTNQIIESNGQKTCRKIFPFLIRVREPDKVPVYVRPNVHAPLSMYADPGVYTVVDISGNWYKLLSGAGWIYIDMDKTKIIRE